VDVALIVKALILGVVEGLTEFLPVSSTGHLIIANRLVKFDGDAATTFDIVIQLGAILGVVWEYRRRLARVLVGFRNERERRFAGNLLIAFLPAAILGLALHRVIAEYLFSPLTVAAALIGGGFVMLAIERLPLRGAVATVDAITPVTALKIGVAQVFSLFPGVSRAAATIMGGLLAGLSRTAATEFSFFLAIPVMVAATSFEFIRNAHAMQPGDLALLAVGFGMAFVTALIVVRLFLAYVGKHSFTAFAYYRVVLGAVALAWFW
jgi:undecaprenyl-diphosphatase